MTKSEFEAMDNGQLTMDNGRLTMKVEIPSEFQYIIAGIIS